MATVRAFVTSSFSGPGEAGKGRTSMRKRAVTRIVVLGLIASMSSTVGADEGPAVVAVIAAPGSQAAPRRWAIVASPRVREWVLADLLTAELSAMPGVQLVERDRIDAALRELTLSELLGAEGIAARLKLGALLRADVLIFLRERKGEDEEAEGEAAVEMAVARTDQGVRVLVYETLWNAPKAGETAAELTEVLGKARGLSQRERFRLFAVPAFESQDVGLQHAEKRAGYARLVERFLTRRDGAAVVELAEARALSRELAIAGTEITRDLPYYVLGSYKTASASNNTTVTFSLELREGEKGVATTKRDAVPQADVPQALEKALDEVLAKVIQQPPSPADLDLEAKLLTVRGDLFRRVGEIDQALPLYESALLCRPRYREAHLSMFEGLRRLLHAGTYHPLWVRGLDYSPRGRMEVAEAALTHLEAIAAMQPPDQGLAGKLGDVADGLDLHGYDTSADWDNAVPAYRRVSHRYDDLLQTVLTDPESHGITRESSPVLAEHAARALAAFYAVDPIQAANRTVALISAMDKQHDHVLALQCQLQLAVRFAGECDRAANAFAVLTRGLEASASERLQFVGQVVRILATIHDDETQKRAMEEIEQLIGTDTVRGTVRKQIKTQGLERLRRLRREETEAAEEAFVLPELTLLNLSAQLSYRGTQRPASLPYVHAWLRCGPDLELLGAEGAVYKVIGPGQLEYFFRSGAVQLHWDGKYVWVVGWTFTSVLTADGREFVRYHDSELKSIKNCKRFFYSPVAPGELCMLGFVYLEPAGVRTWADVLRWEPRPDRWLTKRVESFFEARRQEPDSEDSGTPDDIERAFYPSWAVNLPHGGPNGESVLVAGRRWGHPLVLDPANRTARATSQPWPRDAVFASDGDTVYMASGRQDVAGKCTIQRVEKADQPPEPLVELDPPSGVSEARTPAYYGSVAVCRNQIHLLGRTWSPERRKNVVTWTVVDPVTKRAYVLADPLPEMYGASPTLAASNQYGLVLLTEGRLFSVTLPPQSQWPALSDPVQRSRIAASKRYRSLTEAERVSGYDSPGEETRMFRGHMANVTSVAFSPDGRRAVSGAWWPDRTVVIWDVQTGKALRVFQGDKMGFGAIAWSPDGRHAASGGASGTVRLWDLDEGREARSWTSDKSPIRALAYSPDGSRIVALDDEGILRLWEAGSGRRLYEVRAHPVGARTVAFSHNGRFILSSGAAMDKFAVRLVDAETGREIRQFMGHSSNVLCVAFSPDDRCAVSAGWDGAIRLWDVSSGREIRQFAGHRGGVFSVAFLPDGKHIVSGGGNRYATPWVNADGSIASAKARVGPNPDNTVRVWDVETGAELRQFKGHVGDVAAIAVSPDAMYAITASEDQTVRLWTLPTTAELQALSARVGRAQAAAERTHAVKQAMKTATGPAARVAAAGGLGIVLVFLMLRRGGRVGGNG